MDRAFIDHNENRIRGEIAGKRDEEMLIGQHAEMVLEDAHGKVQVCDSTPILEQSIGAKFQYFSSKRINSKRGQKTIRARIEGPTASPQDLWCARVSADASVHLGYINGIGISPSYEFTDTSWKRCNPLRYLAKGMCTYCTKRDRGDE